MASSSGKKDYPPRLFPAGNSPLQKKSFHNNCKLSEFGMMRQAIGDDVYFDIMNNSQVGVLLKLAHKSAHKSYVWAAKTVHHFVTNQLAVDRQYEMWSLIGGHPLRFSLYEYGEITGLNCVPIDVADTCDIDHTAFWAELGVKPGDGPSFNELVAVLEKCHTWSYEKKKMVALLFILSVGVWGIHRNSRLPLMCAKRVMDETAFERHPWGRHGYKELMVSIKVASFDGDRYTLHGCVHALLIWAYESVPILGEKFGRREENANDLDVPLLRWRSSRTRYTLETVLEEDKRKSEDKKVRVRNLLVVKPPEEIYPIWEDEASTPNVDTKLHNMISDILDGCLDETAWESEAVVKKSRGKDIVKESESEDDFVETPRVKKRKTEIAGTSRVEKNKKEKKKAKVDEESGKAAKEVDMDIPLDVIRREKREKKKEKKREKEREKEIEKERERERKNSEEKSEILKAIQQLSSTLALMHNNVTNVGVRVSDIEKRMSTLEAEDVVKEKKGEKQDPVDNVVDAESNASQGAGAEKKDPVRKSLF